MISFVLIHFGIYDKPGQEVRNYNVHLYPNTNFYFHRNKQDPIKLLLPI